MLPVNEDKTPQEPGALGDINQLLELFQRVCPFLTKDSVWHTVKENKSYINIYTPAGKGLIVGSVIRQAVNDGLKISTPICVIENFQVQVNG